MKWNRYTIGSVISAEILHIKEDGIEFKLKDPSVSGFAAICQINKGIKLKVGSVIKCVVLDVDYIKRVVDISPRAELIKFFRKNPKQIDIGKKMKGRIELVKENYIALSFTKRWRWIGFAPIRLSLLLFDK